MSKFINCTLLANRDFSDTITVTESGAEDKVFLSISLPAELEGKGHRIRTRTPLNYNALSLVLEETEGTPNKIIFVLKTSVLNENGYYFIEYRNEDGKSYNKIRLQVKNFKRVPNVNIPRYIPAANVDFTTIIPVKFIDKIDACYFQSATGKFHLLQADGTELVIDLEVESILDPDNPPYWDDEKHELVITFQGGSVVKIPLSFDFYLKGIKIDGESLPIDEDQEIELPFAAPTGEGQQDGLMSHEDKAKLDGVESNAEVNAIEEIIVDGTSLTPDGDRKVTIPAAAPTGEGQQDGLMSHEDKAILDALAIGIDCGDLEEEEL